VYKILKNFIIQDWEFRQCLRLEKETPFLKRISSAYLASSSTYKKELERKATPNKKVFKIWDKKLKKYTGSYSRAYHDEYEFDSEDSAFNANVHGMYHDTDTYEIHEIEISEKLIKKLPPKKSQGLP